MKLENNYYMNQFPSTIAQKTTGKNKYISIKSIKNILLLNLSEIYFY